MSATLQVPGLGRVHFDPRSREETEFLIKEIFADRSYLRHGIEIAPGAVILDAGANIGLFTLFAKQETKGELTVLAFEPVPSIFRYLEKNMAEHGLGDRVRLFCAGLGRAAGSASFSWFPGLPANSTQSLEDKLHQLRAFKEASLAALRMEHPILYPLLAPAAAARLDTLMEHEEVECPVRTIAEAVEEAGLERIDLLKIDTEGAELDILDGIGEPLWKNVRQVVLETHGARAQIIEARLRSAGFDRIAVERPEFAARLGLDNFNLYARR